MLTKVWQLQFSIKIYQTPLTSKEKNKTMVSFSQWEFVHTYVYMY